VADKENPPQAISMLGLRIARQKALHDVGDTPHEPERMRLEAGGATGRSVLKLE
jgi:hypothetical protein